MIPIVISDIHSRWSKLVKALQLAGVLDKRLERQPGYQLIQVGDAVSAGYGMREASFYRDWVALLEPQDVELVGNHEAPIFTNSNKFYGYEKGDMGTDGCDPELKIEVLSRRHAYQAAHVANRWLITHAGVIKSFQHETAEQTAEVLNLEWARHAAGPCTRSIYECEICNFESGILWKRNLEKTAHEPTQIKQIFGHTPDGPMRSKGGTMWNIDTPRMSTATNRADAESFGGVCVLVPDPINEWREVYVP